MMCEQKTLVDLECNILFKKKKYHYVMKDGLDLITGKYENYRDKNGSPTEASLKSGAFLGRDLRAKAKNKHLDWYREK